MVMLIAPSVAGVFSSFGASIHLRFAVFCSFQETDGCFFVFSAEKRQKEDIPETCPETRVAGA